MKRRTESSAESQDGRLIGTGPDAPRFCMGKPRTVGVQRWDVRSNLTLTDIAAELRAEGLLRSEDGVLCAGQYDLVENPDGRQFAIYIPLPRKSAAGAAS